MRKVLLGTEIIPKKGIDYNDIKKATMAKMTEIINKNIEAYCELVSAIITDILAGWVCSTQELLNFQTEMQQLLFESSEQVSTKFWTWQKSTTQDLLCCRVIPRCEAWRLHYDDGMQETRSCNAWNANQWCGLHASSFKFDGQELLQYWIVICPDD